MLHLMVRDGTTGEGVLNYRVGIDGRHTQVCSCVTHEDEVGCGRTVRNNTPSEALVFHQTLSTPKASYIGRFRRAHPKGQLE